MSEFGPVSEKTALVLFSGGQDSATCLAWALERFSRVETVGFDYGQRHAVEMEARLKVREGMAGSCRNGPTGWDRIMSST
jgi:7-cyano-7-deazaguanine synthase